MKNRFEIGAAFTRQLMVVRLRTRKLALAIYTTGSMLLLAGCSQNDGRVAVYPVKGKVTVNGEIPAGALVVLYPTNSGEDVARPSGKVKADGSFALTTYEADDGAPAGDYVATVQWNKLIKRGESYSAGPNVISKNYAERDTSVWKVKVAEAPNELAPLTIAK